MIFLLVAAALVAGTPLVAAVLVSVASVREDAAKSLAGHPPGRLSGAARRLLRASVGGSGPVQQPRRDARQVTGGRPRWRPEHPNLAGPVPAARWPADDESAARSDRALAAPRS
jgi:hypothetical protein